MDETQRKVDEIRKERSEVENHIIDEYAAGTALAAATSSAAER